MNSTSLAIIQPQELDTIQRAARLLAVSNYFDGKGDNAQAIAMLATKIMAGRELGFGPFASANGIHIISGRPSVGANLMAAAVKGSARYDYRVKEMSADRCAIEFFEREGDKWVSIGISEFTKEEAKAAGTQNMTKFPRNMLFARAMSNGVRWYCPDVFGGNAVYVPEELGAEVDGEGNVIEVVGRTLQDAPTLAQQPQDSAQEAVIVDNDPEAQGTPPHAHMWGVGLATFGKDDWKDARPWLIAKWSAKVTPDNTRNSSSELSEDEKTQFADYMEENRAALQRIWRNHKKAQPEAA